jgi:hypothetical protein
MYKKIIGINIRFVLVAVVAVLLLAVVSYGTSGYGLAGSVAFSSGNQNYSPPAPYTGGGAVSKVFYPADGSTIAITSTGAVIKQSPGGNAYRQGWVDPNHIIYINSLDDLNGTLKSGDTNPYSTAKSQDFYPPAQTYSKDVIKPNSQAYTSAGSNASDYYSSNSSVSEPSAVKSASYTQPSNTSPNNFLPNTGAGNALAIGGLTAVLGTFGHLIYQRLRFH